MKSKEGNFLNMSDQIYSPASILGQSIYSLDLNTTIKNLVQKPPSAAVQGKSI